jgi:hypothetical protein
VNGTPLLVEGREDVNASDRLLCESDPRLFGNPSSYLRVNTRLAESKKDHLGGHILSEEGNCATNILPALQA